MEILGVPRKELAACAAITTIFTLIFFWPAIADFGHTLLGTEDIQFFPWLFTHCEKALANGSNPLWADEIFYPYGISLAMTVMTPLQTGLALLLPAAWGMLGKITFLQILSFLLGGIFTFALAYRFAPSFLPSMVGMVILNFSVFHFEKVLHHLNYSMALPFVALFFIFYFERMAGEKKGLPALALALFLVALSELTVAVMVGFIVAVDLFLRYCSASGIHLSLSPRKVAITFASLLLTLLLFEAMVKGGLPIAVAYTVPALLFLSSIAIFVIGIENLIRMERETGHLTTMALAALPTLAYIGVLALQPSYPVQPLGELDNTWMQILDIAYLFVPSGFQAVSAVTGGLPAISEGGVYLGPIVLAVLALSLLVKGATEEETAMRDRAILCIFFAFPVFLINIPGIPPLPVATPFFVAHAFPLLAFLRVPSRFMLFALLFLAIMAAMVVKRLTDGRADRKLLLLLFLAVLLVERWPVMERFDGQIPAFYSSLAESRENVSLFLYPNFNYYTLLRETYAQSIHRKPLSAGILSRFPADGNGLADLYDSVRMGTEQSNVVKVLAFLSGTHYDYVVVQKLGCASPGCFSGNFTALDTGDLQIVRDAMGVKYGKPVYEDDRIIVYST